MPSKFIWFDVAAADPARVSEFYEELFGWPIAPAATESRYAGWVMDGDAPWAGVTEGDDATAGSWVPYVQVDDLAAARDRAISLGATLVRDSTVGPAGTAVTIADPAGALLALLPVRT